MTPKIKAAIALATIVAVPFEGFRQWAYYDPPGILTVCYGSTTNVQKNRLYSLDECKARLSADMLIAANAVERCAPNAPVVVQAAFIDAAYNIGPKIACDVTQSYAARYIKAGDYERACRELTKWDKARVAGVLVALPGLTKRRAAERDLCLSYSD